MPFASPYCRPRIHRVRVQGGGEADPRPDPGQPGLRQQDATPCECITQPGGNLKKFRGTKPWFHETLVSQKYVIKQKMIEIVRLF